MDDLEVAAAAAAAAMQAMAELQQRDEDSDEVGRTDHGAGQGTCCCSDSKASSTGFDLRTSGGGGEGGGCVRKGAIGIEVMYLVFDESCLARTCCWDAVGDDIAVTCRVLSWLVGLTVRACGTACAGGLLG